MDSFRRSACCRRNCDGASFIRDVRSGTSDGDRRNRGGIQYTSPHSFILVDVKGKDGASAVWNLEGPSPSILARDGMSAKTLKPGDELVLTIDPLRSGAPGGAWALIKTKFKDGRPISGQ